MTEMYPGVHKTTFPARLSRCMISVNVIWDRVSDFEVNDWIMDSGAFTRIASGKPHMPLEQYAALCTRWSRCGSLRAAVAQDYMCEPFIVERTGLTVKAHQDMSTQRYLKLRDMTDAYVMPVVQGYDPEEYREHASDLSRHLDDGSWVGVGSVCKRQGDPDSINAVLDAVLSVNPTWRLHGFGVKYTSLADAGVRRSLDTSDSMAWSYAARREKHARGGTGPGPNDWESLVAWIRRLEQVTGPQGLILAD